MDIATPSTRNVFEAFRGFSRRRIAQEACEICGLGLAAEHPHLLQVSNQQVLCACDPCATLFTHRSDGRQLVRIPRDARALDPFQLSAAQWDGLRLPIDLAFFIYSLPAGRMVVRYPSPAGNTESHLSLDTWQEIERANPPLEKMEAGVEALLVDRTRGGGRYFIAPIDQCYRLTGLIRTNWRGFSGGEEVWKKIDEFFAWLAERARA